MLGGSGVEAGGLLNPGHGAQVASESDLASFSGEAGCGSAAIRNVDLRYVSPCWLMAEVAPVKRPG